MEYELKRWKEKYAQELCALLKEERLSGCLPEQLTLPCGDEEAENFIKARIYADDEKELCRAVVVDVKPIGSVELYRREGCFSATASLYFWVCGEYIEEDIISKALTQLCDEAQRQLLVSRIEAFTLADDLPARSALNDAGFNLEGVMSKSIAVDGVLRDRCVYSRVAYEAYTD